MSVALKFQRRIHKNNICAYQGQKFGILATNLVHILQANA